MIINHTNLSAMFNGFNTTFAAGFAGAPSTYKKIAMQAKSSGREEVYGWLGQQTNIREWVGDRVITNLSVHDYTIKNRKFEATIGVSRDDIADDRYGVLSPFIGEMGHNAAMHPDELVYELIASGFAALCYDGQPFFDTDHPVIDAAGAVQSVSNFGGGAGTAWYLLDTSRAVRPFVFQVRDPYRLQTVDGDNDDRVFLKDEYLYGVRARANAGFGLWQLAYASKQDLDAESYEAARAAMQSLKGDHGKKLGVMPNLLVVPPTLEGKGRALLKAATGDAGASNIWADSAELLVTPFLE
jgi:phage major head subunit gpT-like protein